MKRYVIKRKDGRYWNRERGTWEEKLSAATKFPVSTKKRAAFKKNCSLCGHEVVAVRKKQLSKTAPVDSNVRWVVKDTYLHMYHTRDSRREWSSIRKDAFRYMQKEQAFYLLSICRMPSFDPESIKVFRVTQKRSRS